MFLPPTSIRISVRTRYTQLTQHIVLQNIVRAAVRLSVDFSGLNDASSVLYSETIGVQSVNTKREDVKQKRILITCYRVRFLFPSSRLCTPEMSVDVKYILSLFYRQQRQQQR